MFNLLMFHVNWKSLTVTVPIERMFEYTDDHLADQFRQGDRLLLDRLTALPCLFCDEGTTEQVAYVGQINRLRISGKSLSLEISFDVDVPPLQNSTIFARRRDLDMLDNYEFSRNHWAIKDVDLYKFLLRHIRPRRQYPTVFQIPEHENVELTLISAMMPFEARFNAVYASIKQAAESVGLQCQRADDIWENSAIIQDIVALIDRSCIVICDCSGKNSNVFYEAGIAHTLGREVILITQNENDIPFDLRHLRYIHYLNNKEGHAALIEELKNRMQILLGH